METTPRHRDDAVDALQKLISDVEVHEMTTQMCTASCYLERS